MVKFLQCTIISRKMKSIKNSKHQIGDGHLPMIIMTKY